MCIVYTFFVGFYEMVEHMLYVWLSVCADEALGLKFSRTDVCNCGSTTTHTHMCIVYFARKRQVLMYLGCTFWPSYYSLHGCVYICFGIYTHYIYACTIHMPELSIQYCKRGRVERTMHIHTQRRRLCIQYMMVWAAARKKMFLVSIWTCQW